MTRLLPGWLLGPLSSESPRVMSRTGFGEGGGGWGRRVCVCVGGGGGGRANSHGEVSGDGGVQAVRECVKGWHGQGG